MRGADAGPPGPTPSASSPSRGGSRRGDFHWSEYRRSVENFVNSGEALRASADQFASLKDTYRRPLASMTHSMAADAQAYANENEQFRNGFVSRSLDDQERMRNFIKAPRRSAGHCYRTRRTKARCRATLLQCTARAACSKRNVRRNGSPSRQTTLPPRAPLPQITGTASRWVTMIFTESSVRQLTRLRHDGPDQPSTDATAENCQQARCNSVPVRRRIEYDPDSLAVPWWDGQ